MPLLSSVPIPYGTLSGKSNGAPVGLAGVGGGGCGASGDLTVVNGDSESRSLARASCFAVGSSVSVSEPASSSQDSATGADLGLCAGF